MLNNDLILVAILFLCCKLKCSLLKEMALCQLLLGFSSGFRVYILTYMMERNI